MMQRPCARLVISGVTRFLLACGLSGSVSLTAYATSVEDIVSDGLESISQTPVQSAVGFVIGQICPSGTIITDSDLQARCNEIAVAGVVDSDPDNDQSARDGLQAMGAEEGAAVASLQVDSQGAQIDAIGQRISAVRGGATVAYRNANGFQWSGGAAGDGASAPWGIFVNGLYANSDRDTTAREAGFEADDYGVTAGVDYSFADEVLIGAAFGYKDSDADIDRNGGKLETDSMSYFAYWSLYPDEHWFVDGMVGYTDNDHDQERNIIYSIPALVGGGTTSVNNTALSNTDSDEVSVSLAAGRNFNYGSWVISPLARFEYADVDIDGFTERMSQTAAAGGGLALDIDSQHFDSMTLTAGATVSSEWQTAFGKIYPQATAEYVHEFKNDNDPSTGRFVNDSSRTTIVLLTDSPDRNYFNLGAGLIASFADNVTGFVRYQALLGYEDLDVQAVEIGIRANF